MTEHHVKEKKTLKSIIYNHVHLSNEDDQINLEIQNLLIKNSPPRGPEAENHYAYRYTCDEKQCNLYHIGYIQCVLKQRFSGHEQNGQIKNHTLEHHPGQTVKTNELLNNVSILYRSNDKANFVIAEALYIHRFKSKVNTQSEFCHGTLHLF